MAQELKTFNPRSSALAHYKLKSTREAIYGDSFTAVLADALQLLVEDVANRVDVNERSHNLIDSIGALLIVNGRSDKQDRFYARTPESYGLHKGWPKHGIEANTGRGYLDEYFDTLVSQYKGSHGFKIFVCAAAYYAQFLEDGSYRQDEHGNYLGRKYHIISFSKSALEGILGEVASVWSSRNGVPGSKTGGVRNFIVSNIGTPFSISH